MSCFSLRLPPASEGASGAGSGRCLQQPSWGRISSPPLSSESCSLRLGQGARRDRRCRNAKQLVNLNGVAHSFRLKRVCEVGKVQGLEKVLNRCVESILALGSELFLVKCILCCIKIPNSVSSGGLGRWQKDFTRETMAQRCSNKIAHHDLKGWEKTKPKVISGIFSCTLRSTTSCPGSPFGCLCPGLCLTSG